jgi:hypothetical protein
MCLLSGMNWDFISQKTAFFVNTSVKTSNLTYVSNLSLKVFPILLQCDVMSVTLSFNL